MKAVVGSLAFVLLAAVPAVADSLNCRQAGRCEMPGYAFDVSVSGHFAYVGAQGAGLRVVT